ncbi:MAG: CDP-alcohol phosphatidyltransferase family protein [Acidimicrobiia bacterium]|nr:CDP-alcohol phosphatidyltransferase family protein [Acidimicrobiia bacterium]
MADKRFGPTALATPANAVTLARILGSIGLTVLILAGLFEWALAVFIVLALSDNIDGLIARRQGATRSGAFLDPLADKVLVGGALFGLAVQGRVAWAIFVLVMVREVAVSAYRSYAVRRGVSVPASWWGKVKTFVTLSGIGLLLIPGDGTRDVGVAVLWAAVVLTWVSAIELFVRAERSLREGTASGSAPPGEMGRESASRAG